MHIKRIEATKNALQLIKLVLAQKEAICAARRQKHLAVNLEQSTTNVPKQH